VKLIFPPPPAGQQAETMQHRRGHRAVPPCESRGEIIRLAMRENNEDRVSRAEPRADK
jgi:hypothetical protein